MQGCGGNLQHQGCPQPKVSTWQLIEYGWDVSWLVSCEVLLVRAREAPVCCRRYAAAAELLPARSTVGGEARLRQAICLDSLGRNQEAYDIYTQIRSHLIAAVAKQANR